MPALIVYTNPLTPGICQMPVYTVGDDQNWTLQFNDGTHFYNPAGVSINIGFIRGLSDLAYASAFQLVDRTNSVYTGSVTLASGVPGALTWDENPTAVFGGNGAYIVKGRLPGSQVRKVYIVAGGAGLSTAPSVLFDAGLTETGQGATATVAISAGGLGTVTITNRGRAYSATNPPRVIVSGDGTGGAAYVTTVTAGQIQAISVGSLGSGYTAATLQIVDPEATATTTVGGSSGVTGAIVTGAGAGYTTAPTIAITGGGGASATATAALLVSSWGLRSVTLTGAGSAFTSVPTVSFSGGTGSGATAVATINDPSMVFAVTLTNAGSGYLVSTVDLTFSGGSGSGAAGYGIIDNTTSGVSSVVITNAGTGYTSAPTVTFPAPSLGINTATGTAVLGDGKIATLTLTAPGSGYGATAPTVGFSGGGGSGATATAQLIGSPISPIITITAAGSGYTSAPLIGFSGGAGAGATATATVSLGITAITMTQGGYAYTGPPNIYLEPMAGTSAGAILVPAGPLAHSVPFLQNFNPTTAANAISCTPYTNGRRDSSGNLIYDDALLIVRPRYLVQPTLSLQGDALTWAGFFTPATTMVQAVLQYRRSFTADVEIFGGGRLLFVGSLTIAAA